jgi:hypothetical protein
MDVDHAPGWNGEDVGSENVSICHNDAEVGLEAPQTGGENIADGTHRLENSDSSGLGCDFDGGRNQLGPRPPLWLIRLGDHTGHGEAAVQQRLQ